ncbi:hypothetical protein ACHAXS_003771 [Conticribra weissflogii]
MTDDNPSNTSTTTNNNNTATKNSDEDPSGSLAAQLSERLIHQEYKIWKKNTPYLYDYVLTHGLVWPSLTCQWLPPVRQLNDGKAVGAIGGNSKNVAEEHSLLIGTHTAGDEMNYLMVCAVNLPRDDVVVDVGDGGEKESGDGNGSRTKEKQGEGDEGPSKKQKTQETDASSASKPIFTATNYNEEKNELGGYSSTTAANGLVGKIEIRLKIPHDGEVNRARYMPQNHFIVATRGPSPEVYIWDLSKHGSFPEEGATPCPQIVCRGHTGEGYGVSWCGVGEEGKGRLCTCAEDRTVRIWDVNQALKDGKNGMVVRPTDTLQFHTDVVEDVDWHKRDINMIGSCGDDRLICLWDVREGKREKPAHIIRDAHKGDVNSLAFHPTNEFLMASGSADKMVKLWDMRNLKSPLQTLEGHTDQVYSIQWSPFHESILGSCSADRRVAIWDLSRIGAEQSPEDAEDGPPELLFLHGGHTANISDFSWNANYDWCCASVSADNVLQVWCPTEEVYADGEEEEEEQDDGEEDLAIKKRTEILGDDELE